MTRVTCSGVVVLAVALAGLSGASQALAAGPPRSLAAAAARGSAQARAVVRRNEARRAVARRRAARRRAARRSRERRRLTRDLRRNPRRALRGAFLRRAAIAGLRVPVTVRLRPGTQLGVSWIAARFPLDAGLFPAATGEQTIDLGGGFPMVIDFGAGPGYGGPGNIQARSGPGGSIRADGPLAVADLAGCTATPPPFAEAATSTTGGAPIAASAAAATWVDMNPFTGASDGYLDLTLSMRTRVLESSATCATPGSSADYDIPASTDPSDPWLVPLRLRWDGSFRIAPAIASDGAIRFGRITADGATRPQAATTGNVWGCAPQAAMTGAGLPLAETCPAVGTPLAEPVGPAPFPASLVVKNLSADILLGQVGY